MTRGSSPLHHLKYHPVFAIIIAMLGGATLGHVWGPGAASLGEFSKWIITALKAVALPLLFLVIVDALLKSFVSVRGFASFLVVATINASCAVAIALVINNVFHPGGSLTFLVHAKGAAQSLTHATWQEMLGAFIPSSILDPFVSGSTPGVIVIALAVGFSLRHIKSDASLQTSFETFHGLIHLCYRALLVVIYALVMIVPIAVFCSVAKAVGQNGLGVFYDLGIFVAFCLIALGVQAVVVYHAAILLHPKISVAQFWRRAKAPVLYAFGVNSSLATMPLTLDALDDLRVRPEAARMSACIGTNFNNDGILLYELLAALMIADAYGLNLTLFEQIAVAGFAVVAALGVAGFPEAGIIALTLVLTMLKLPTEAIAIILSVDWIIARCRSSTNVLGDLAVALHIDRWLAAPKRDSLEEDSPLST